MRALYLMRLFWEIVLRNLRCCLNRWDSADRTVVRKGLNHECEVFRRKCDEAAESQYAWENCKKNPCHEKFIPVHDFINNHLPESLCDKEREQIVAFVDLTVRIRVSRTSRARPADDVLSNCRGDDRLRVGTGFIWRASSNTNKPCPCDECEGKIMRKHWTFYVRTAQHVVYNTEEAQGTRIDLFYDDENSLENKQAVTVFASRVVWSSAGCDVCHMECVTHDEKIGERIESLLRRVLSLFYCNTYCSFSPKMLAPSDRYKELLTGGCHDHAMIVSHPHGRPKQITVGKVRGGLKRDHRYLEYYAATCPGSSGAPVIRLNRGRRDQRWLLILINFCHWYWGLVHSGTYDKPSLDLTYQVNYGNWEM